MRARVAERARLLWARDRSRRAIKGLVVLGALGAAGITLVVVLNLIVLGSSDDRRYTEVAAVPERPVAIVFGAAVYGTDPSPALRDRLDGAISLYDSGQVDHLLMSGDHSRPDYDEVTVMRDYAIAHGVPGEDITRDYAGFDTYDTCFRAKEIFGVTAATLVTQDFHLSRALYTCDQLGIDVVGLAIPDWNFHADQPGITSYPPAMQRNYTVREWFARAKAFVDTNVVHPEPTYEGQYEGLTET